MPKEKKENFNMRLPVSLIRAIRKAAREARTTPSEMARQALFAEFQPKEPA